MILSDTGSAIVTAITFLLLYFGDLQIWHIYLLAFFGSAFSAFQEPAYTASVTMMVPKEQLARSSSLTQMGQAISVILTPLMAGALYGLVELNGIIMIDAVTYFFAIGALVIVRIPQPKRVTEEDSGGEKTIRLAGSRFWLELSAGFAGIVWFAALLCQRQFLPEFFECAFRAAGAFLRHCHRFRHCANGGGDFHVCGQSDHEYLGRAQNSQSARVDRLHRDLRYRVSDQRPARQHPDYLLGAGGAVGFYPLCGRFQPGGLSGQDSA